MKLKFEGRWICDENGNLAYLSVREHLPEAERYSACLNDRFDYMSASELRECIAASNELQAFNISESFMLASFKMQLQDKLHDCLMKTDVAYRQEHEIEELRRQVKQLEGWIDEERGRRIRAENEVSCLLKKIKSIFNEDGDENENEERENAIPF